MERILSPAESITSALIVLRVNPPISEPPLSRNTVTKHPRTNTTIVAARRTIAKVLRMLQIYL